MNDVNFMHFFAQADTVARGILTILLCMSIASWSLILIKLYQHRGGVRERRAFLLDYQASPHPAGLEQWLHQEKPDQALGRIALAGFAAWKRWRFRAGDTAGNAVVEDLLDQALHRRLMAERAVEETGLGFLASIASTAPFVGLFGTVWGIHHALLSIARTGQASLDKVAGPVGEALVMTAIGLAVAIPASLAYNAFLHKTRKTVAELEDFSQDFHAFLITGIHSLHGKAS